MSAEPAAEPASPPRARREPRTHRLHGVERTDAYGWLRAVEDPAVLAHLDAERAYYDAAVHESAPLARHLADAIIARMPPTERGVTVDRRHWVYYPELPEGAEHGQLRRYPRSEDAPAGAGPPPGDELVLDIDGLRATSPYVDLGLCELSPDERLIAYSVDLTGDEVYELRFRDLATGLDLPDRVPRSYYTGAWSTAGDHFFYTVHDEAYRPFEVRRHALGTDPADDVVVFEEPDEQYEVTVTGCRSGRLIVIGSENRDTTEQWLVDPAHPQLPPRCVEPRRRGLEYRVEHAPHDGPDAAQGDRLLIVTNLDAPEFTVMTAPTSSPGLAGWQTFRPYEPAERILSADAFAGFMVLRIREGGRPALVVLASDGRPLRRVDPPVCGHVELGDNPRWDTPSIVVERYSHLEPRVWSEVDVATGVETVRHREQVPNYDPTAYESSGLAVEARDGAVVPVTLVRRRDTPLDGTAPCLLYGYGAYEAVVEPEFDPALIALLDRGVVFAYAAVRGGGECGRHWWLNGRLEHKHHTFEDHIDVADALAATHVDGARLGTRGLSAGGLLQAAVFSQRPDRWRAVIAEVPFVDVVTTMLDASIPLTANEWDEWGDPRRAADFDWLLRYSPYDNVPAPGGRPDLLVTGAVHDARVMVWEPAKWVAALRHSDPEWAARCLFRVDTGAGAHTGPSGRFAKAEYEAEIYAWLLTRLNAAE